MLNLAILINRNQHVAMYEDLRDRAIANLEKRKKKVKAMQIIGVILGSIATFLFFIRYTADASDRPYFFIPIGILGLVYCIIHTAVLGLPFVDDIDITEEDIEQEVARVYRKYKFSDIDDMSDDEHLELKQIETMLRDGEDYV